MGNEVEYSVSAHCGGRRVKAEQVCHVMLDMLRSSQAWLPQHRGDGFYTENGFRCYPEINGHVEMAAPEVVNPRQAALYDKVGEHMLLQAAARARTTTSLEVTICKHNVGAVFDTVSFGHHESYRSFVSAQTAAKVLLSHLATRSLYAGSGCFWNHPDGVFSLSQRAQFICADVSSSTEGERPLLCTRVRRSIDRGRQPGGGTWWRAHILCGDSHRSPFSTYLTFGTTGLLFEMLNRRWKFRRLPRLQHPVSGLHQSALDPYFRRPLDLCDAGKATALDIQSAYCEEAERFVRSGGGPEWAAELVQHWRETLDTADRDPLLLAPRLDAYHKLHVLERQIERAGYDWSIVHGSWRRLNALRMNCSDKVVLTLLNGQSGGLNAEDESQLAKANESLRSAPDVTLDHLRFVVRLQALQLQFHVLGGWYDQLAADGLADPVVLSDGDIEQARHAAPTGTRAAARGRYVRHLQPERDQWYCSWDGLRHVSLPKRIDLSDPLDARGREVESRENDPNADFGDFLF